MSGVPLKAKGKSASRFRLWQRVRPSELAIKRNIEKREVRGTVTGFAYGGYSIRVLRDGRKLAISYHPDFWEPCR